MKSKKGFFLSFLLVFKFYFGTDHVAQVGLKLANLARDSILILVLHFSHAGITGVPYYAYFMWCWG